MFSATPLCLTCGGMVGGIVGGGTFGGGTPGGGIPILGGGILEFDGGATVGSFGGMIGGGSEIDDDSTSFFMSSTIQNYLM